MFTRFSMPSQRRDPAPVAGPVVSLAAHATLVVLLVGGPSGTGTGAAAGEPAHASTDPVGGERIQWVGSRDADGSGASSAPSENRPPIAYVVPGKGPLREVTAPVAPRRRPSRGTATSVPPMRPPDARRLKFWQRQLLPLPRLPEVDVAMLVAGVVAAAPDLDRLVTRPEDFHPLRRLEDPAALLALANVLTPNGPRPVGPVDVLPIAFVSNPKPMYPTFLARSGVGGRVLVEFTIDSAGTVDLASLQVVRSTNDMFTQAVRAVLPQLHFLPAQISQHAVGVRVRQPFEFRIGSRD